MKIQTITPKKAVNKAYLKERINKTDIDKFKTSLVSLFDLIQATDKEQEGNRKTTVTTFLKSLYTLQYEINSKGNTDLVIHTGKTAKEPVAVIFETKKPDSSEMMNDAKPNTKAVQQLVLYYLDERIEHKNTAVKHLIATDFFNWYIFDENLFDKHIYRNPKFIKGYETYKQGNKGTDFFYKEIAKPLLDDLDVTFECTHFNLKNYEKTVRNTADTEGDKTLIALYKIFSPVHLLKLPFANDSNQLDKSFYTELLHIIGLEEIKDGSKKLIKPKAKPDEFSLLENTITKIENKGFSNITDLQKFGSTKTEQAQNIALELCITWVNRILFLKLLEAQLVTYHKGNTAFRFLNSAMIYDYDRLNKLFFEVLAEKTDNRKGKVKTEFAKIPYLNSSLFERTDLERKTIEINYLDDREEIPILSNTVLKDAKGKKETGNLPTLEYLFAFLDSYDFASEGTEGIQEDKRTLINASVLGLIFEKINGYKDGSFFTPSFITMYMCRETIRRAVVQKFKENGYKSETFDDLKDEIHTKDRQKANALINSLKICDPAVGSGHFLVSALNEIIAIKSDLDILSYRDGNRVRNYKIEIQNDELIVTDEQYGDIFQYFVNDKGTPPQSVQKLQETLFHEKQTIIENCLFGVDINPNSVKICRLRLWIELLKNAYYTEGSQFEQLETLPNIDINIKQGNSLISRFKLDDDLSDVFKKQKFTYNAYSKAVKDYKKTNSKEAKAELIKYLIEIKEQFQTIFTFRHPLSSQLKTKKAKLFVLENPTIVGNLFEKTVSPKSLKAIEKLKKEVAETENAIQDIKNNVIYSDAFEWRFEFPEVLDTEGEYVGFDAIIGNPPYMSLSKMSNVPLFEIEYSTYSTTSDLYALFYELGSKVLKKDGILMFISGSAWLKASHGKALRRFFSENVNPEILIDFSDCPIFDEATVLTTIVQFTKQLNINTLKAIRLDRTQTPVLLELANHFDNHYSFMSDLDENAWVVSDSAQTAIKSIIESQSVKLKKWSIKIDYGIKTGINDAFYIDEATKNRLITTDSKSSEIIVPMLRGRDIRRYGASFENIYLINSHNGESVTIENPEEDIIKNEEGIKIRLSDSDEWIEVKRLERAKGKKYRINRVIVELDYPAIFEHLKQYENGLRTRLDKGNHWTNLRNCTYLSEFEKDKIIYPNMTKFFPFMYDTEGYYTNQKCYIMTGKHLKYLVAFFNSKLFKFCYAADFPELQGNTRELNKVIFEQISVKMPDETQEKEIVALVEQILTAKQSTPSVSTAELEKEIDNLVYGLYGLTGEEIEIIEQSVK